MLLPVVTSGQTIRGVIRDQATRAPIPNAHITILNTRTGTIAAKDGSYKLRLEKLPSSIEVSCLGYETIQLEIIRVSDQPTDLWLKHKTYDLSPVTISSQPATAVYRDEDYSVLDYHFLGDDIALLVFRYQLNRSEIILLSLAGDTLSDTPVPSVPPEALFRDVFGNLHYLTKKGEAFQCHYDPVMARLIFPFRTTADSLQWIMKNLRFAHNDRVYFQEEGPRGFLTTIGYFAKGKGKTITKKSIDLHGLRHYLSQAAPIPIKIPPPDAIDFQEVLYENPEARAFELFYKRKTCGSLFRINDRYLAFFNYCDNLLEFTDFEGKVIRTVPITFHQDQAEGLLASITGTLTGSAWEWNKELLQDDMFGQLYTCHTRHGITRLSRVDLITGTLSQIAEIPFAFPEKIRIHRGDAYFLYRGIGETGNWKLFKMNVLQ